MEIYNNYCEIIGEVQLDTRFVNPNCVLDDGCNVLLLYEEPNFLKAIKYLLDQVWDAPDYQRSKAYFYIRNGDVSLSVEAYPKFYSNEEKFAMLEAANKTEREGGGSDYFDLMDMFERIDQILSEADSTGDICVYRLGLDDQEKEILLNLHS